MELDCFDYEKLKADLEQKIKAALEWNPNENKANWRDEGGVLLTPFEAKMILKVFESKDNLLQFVAKHHKSNVQKTKKQSRCA